MQPLKGLGILMLILFNHSLFAQQCSQIGSNPICAQDAAAQGSMVPFTFQEGCFSATMNYCFYLETGGQAGPAVLAVQREDCDYIFVNPVTGTASAALDSIFVTIVGFPDGGDPCDQSNYNYQSSCYLFTTQTTFLNVPNLPTNSSLMVVVGSNHDPLFGPCSIKIQASGAPFELNTTVDPIFIYAGQEAYLTCEGASVGADYAWTPDEFVSNPTAANTAAFPTESTDFFVTSTIGSCIVTDSVNVPVGVPISYGNAISPNGDYINDEWNITGIEKFERAEVSVFDRWGQSVFHSIGYGSPWNGTNRGKMLPTGPYYYVIELNSPVVFIKPITGYISIVR